MPSTKPRQITWVWTSVKHLFGNRASLSAMVEPGDAITVRRRKAKAKSQHERLMGRVEALPQEVKDKIVSSGGDVLKMQDKIKELRDLVNLAIPPRVLWGADPSQWRQGVSVTAAQLDQIRATITRWQEGNAAELEALQPLALTAEPAADFNLDSLYANWLKTEPKVTRKHAATLDLFKKCMNKPMDYRKVSADDCWSFLRWLEASGASVVVCRKHLDNLRGLFKAARQHVRTNPAAGVNPLGKAVEAPRMVLSGAQTAAILEAATDTKLGGRRDVKRHAELLWCLKIMAHTGMRPGEVTQLQRGDMFRIGNVIAIQVREECCVTGKRHLEKTVKTGEARVVPLVPELGGAFYAWATDGEPGEFVFSCFPFGKVNKRVGPVGDAFRCVVRKLRMTPPPGERLDSYCLRHRFTRAARDRECSDKHIEYVTGHAANLHDRYGRGVGLKHLAATVAAVRPLED